MTIKRDTKNKKVLILFSGQLDSIKNLNDFLIEYPTCFVDLLYIKNIGFRNHETIPIELARKVKNVFRNIEDFYIVDGKIVQHKLINYIVERLKKEITIIDCCIICQFGIRLIYALLCRDRDKQMVNSTKIWGAEIEKILKIPLRLVEETLSIKNNHDMPTSIISSLKCDFATNKCQLSYFHNYNFHKQVDFNYLQPILQMFIHENSISNITALLKLKKINLEKGDHNVASRAFLEKCRRLFKN